MKRLTEGQVPDTPTAAATADVSVGRRQALAAAGSLVLGSALPSIARAQSDWPTKPVRLVVPFPAGGGADLGARVVAVHLASAFVKPVVV